MPPAAALWIALESLATFRATFFLCRTPFEPAREMAEDAFERTFAASSTPLLSRVDRTSLMAVFTEERMCRFLVRRFKLCLCRLIADLVLAKRFLLRELEKCGKPAI